jgi:hypothetical protein
MIRGGGVGAEPTESGAGAREGIIGMARRPNYDHVKRQKELERQKKKEAKAERKRLAKEENTARRDEGSPDEGGIPSPAAEDGAPPTG